MAVQKQDYQHKHTFSNSVRIQDVVQKTCLRWWTIGKSGERGPGISVLPARHDDDDDDCRAVYNVKSLIMTLEIISKLVATKIFYKYHLLSNQRESAVVPTQYLKHSSRLTVKVWNFFLSHQIKNMLQVFILKEQRKYFISHNDLS